MSLLLSSGAELSTPVISTPLFTNIPQNVIDHIEEGVYEVSNPNILVCIDGRTPKEHTYGGGTTPGGTLGTYASILSGVEHEFTVGFGETALQEFQKEISSLRRCVFEILKAQVGGRQNVYYHTDEHSCDCGKIGCGHLRFALDDTGEHDYKLSPESKEYILNIREKIYKNNSGIILKGNHEERHVLIVQGKSHSVAPNNALGQAFVSTPDLVFDQKRELAEKVFPQFSKNIKLSSSQEQLFQAMIGSYQRHIANTVNALAKGLPQYSATFTTDGKIDMITQV